MIKCRITIARRKTLVALVLVATSTLGMRVPVLAEPGLERLAWLAGHWVGSEGETSTEELWMAPRGGLMLGLHRDVTGDKAFFELLRIESGPDGLVYLASPGGKPPTPFALEEIAERRVTFANPEHDFPQRITYELGDDGVLVVSIQGDVDGETRGRSWKWRRSDAD